MDFIVSIKKNEELFFEKKRKRGENKNRGRKGKISRNERCSVWRDSSHGKFRFRVVFFMGLDIFC